MSFGICPSIGVGLSGSAGLSPAWLVGRLQAAFGARLTGLHQDNTLVANADWPSVVGSPLTNTDDATWQVTQAANGKRILSAASGVPRLQVATGTTKTVVWVGVAPTVPGAGTYVIGGGTGVAEIFVVAASATEWYTVAGTTIYVDGVSSHATPTGLHVYEAVIGGTATGLTLGYQAATDNYPTRAQYQLVMRLSDALSALERTALLTTLQQYYRLA